jgi:hypothetical protein
VVLLTRLNDAVTSPQLVHIIGTARQNRPATLLTRTFLKVSFFPGGCHVYPHHDEVPVDQQYTKVIPSSPIEDKMQSKIEVPIESDNDDKDHVTHWQELVTIKQGQEQEDPDSKVSATIHLEAGNKFIVSFGEHTGYMRIYHMKNKDEMPKVIKK